MKVQAMIQVVLTAMLSLAIVGLASCVNVSQAQVYTAITSQVVR